jgi:hypothetical protein
MADPLSNSNTFSFNFLIPETEEPSIRQNSESKCHGDIGRSLDSWKVIANDNIPEPMEIGGTQPPRLPFNWIDDDYLKALMLERSQQALVYTDMILGDEDVQDMGSKMIRNNDETMTGNADEVDDNGTDGIDDNTQEKTSEEIDLQRQIQPIAVRCVDLSLSSFRIKSSEVEDTATPENVDIVPGLYEGGGTVWECSRDLLQYMAKNKISIHERYRSSSSNTSFLHHTGGGLVPDSENETTAEPSALFALELGCGHGLPGCYILSQALRFCDTNNNKPDFTVVFTDYNTSVLFDATVSNIVVNGIREINDQTDDTFTTPDMVAAHVVMGGGDWMDMSKQLRMNASCHKNSKLPTDGYFDMILATETIYSTSAAYDTALFLQRHLRPETGIAYIASKRYYFGVGGGVDVFRDFCTTAAAAVIDRDAGNEEVHTRRDVQLHVDTLETIDNGTGNIREILRVQSRFAADTVE